MGDEDRSFRNYEQALAILTNDDGTFKQNAEQSLKGLADIWRKRGDAAKAEALYRRAITFLESHGKEDSNLAFPESAYGNALVEWGRPREARPHLTHALELWTNALGDSHPYLAYPLTGLGHAHLDLGETGVAIKLLERALRLRSDPKLVDPPDRAETEFALARALWKQGRERDRAVELAKTARRGFSGERFAKRREQIDKWLAGHPEE